MKFKLTHSLVAITMIASPLVFADDAKMYPGADCDRHSGSDNYDRNNGSIRNSSTELKLVVMCPILKTTTDTIGGGELRLIDRNPGGNVKCTIYSDGENGRSHAEAKTKGSSPFPQEKSFGPVIPMGADAHHYIKCVIPPAMENPNNSNNPRRSAVVSYQVNTLSPPVM